MSEGLGLSNYQIDNHFRGNPLYGGCLSKDELVNISPNNKFWVINLQDSVLPGSHWVAVIDIKLKDSNPDYCIYFDPYGVYPPPSIVSFMEKSDKPLQYVCDTFQDLDSTKCGQYCLMVIDSILKSVPYKKLFDDLLDEDDVARNERLIKKFKLRK